MRFLAPIADNRPLMNPIFFVGPAVAAIGLVAVFFVMRHKSVEKRSMYSSRRSQIEHKVRAARQRTLIPLRHGEKESATLAQSTSAAAPTLTYEPSAYAGPPVAPPPKKTHGAQPVWDAGPTAPAALPGPPIVMPPPPPLAYEPPAYEMPPAVESPAGEPAAEPAAEPAWTPTPAPEPAQPERPAPAPAAATSAGAGASWSVVGETKGSAEPEPVAKRKKSKGDPQAPWSLASGVVPGDEAEEGGSNKPSAAIAVAQYAVLVVGLVMVLIGVVVMLANSHFS
jgi:hypothetical protein